MQKFDKKVFSVLFFSLFVNVIGVGIVVPLLPVYAHDLGASGLYIGLLFGGFSLSRTVFLPYFGRKSDRTGRKPFIIAGLFVYAAVSVAFVLFHSVESLIIIRTVQGIASAMIIPVIQAYVGDITPAGREGTMMGIFNMSLFFGLSIGPLAGGVINDRFSMTAAFVCMGFMALGGFVLSLMLLPPTNLEKGAGSRGKPQVPWRKLLGDRELIGLVFFRLTYTACMGIIWGFVPVLAEGEFTTSSAAIGLLVMLGVFISGVIQTPMGLLADRFSQRAMVVVGGLLTGYAVFAYYSAHVFNDLLYASIIFGLGGGVAMPALTAMAVLKGAKAEAMGSVMAILTVAHSLGMMVGSIFAGFMMDLFELRDAFSSGALIMLLGVVAFIVCTRRSMQGGVMVK